MESYENKALLFAEKYGIIEYEVIENKMFYEESFSRETYECVVNLDDMQEKRELKK